MATKRDYYEILGVARDATPVEIKRAYRRLARECHPDVNKTDPTAEERFKELGEAYAVLSDEQRRAQYDLYGHDAPAVRDWTAPDIFEIFNMAFGGMGRQRGPVVYGGEDLEAEVVLTLEEVATGVEKEVAVSRLVTCEECGGNGAEPGTEREPCPTCGGAGQVRRSRATILGHFSQIGTWTRKLSVNIPAGVEDGQQVRLAGEGDAGPYGGPAGDLYVVIRVQEHPVFRRGGRDIACEVELNFAQAALGHVMEVPTLNGPVEIGIPAGTQHGEVFTLKGYGLPDVRSGRRGDEHVAVRVAVPRKLNKKQRELLLKFAESAGCKVTPHEGGFFKRVKEAFHDK